MPMAEFTMLIIATCAHNGRDPRQALHRIHRHHRWPGIGRECIISTRCVVPLLREEEAIIIAHHPEVEVEATVTDNPLHLYPHPPPPLHLLPHPPPIHHSQIHVLLVYLRACHNFQMMIPYLRAGKKDCLGLAGNFLLITTHGRQHGHIPARDGIQQVFHRLIPQVLIPAVAVEAPHCTANVSQLGTLLFQSLILRK